MSAKKIANLPAILAVALDDICVVEQTVGITTTTYKATVRQLIGCVMPSPEITLLTWNSGPKTLDIECENILPNSLIKVDGKFYAISAFIENAHPNYKATVSIPAGLAAGDYEVVVSNMFINESTGNFTV